MKTIPLTHGKEALVDDKDYDVLIKQKWYLFKNKGGKGYYAKANTPRVSGKKRTSILMHRVIMGVTKREDQVDHIDRNGLNNQRDNLRKSTQATNNKNVTPYGTSKYLGVCWNKKAKRWVASICTNNKHKYLGSFIVEEDAAKAYDEAAKKYHKEFANLNFKP